MLEQLVLFLVSFLSNVLSAFSGGGAGLVQLPALILLGLPFALALATHKVASVALGLGATLRHLREDSLQRRFIILLLLTGLPGVILGASLVLQLPELLARLSLGMLTLGLGIYSIFKPDLGQQYEVKHRDTAGYLWGGAVLFPMGILNGSLTSGSGLFVTLWLIHWFGLDYRRAVAHTLVLVGLFWNGSGALVLGLIGEVYWQWLPVLLLGSILGGYAGAHLSITRGNRLIKRTFELVTILLGMKLIHSAWGLYFME
ncbi:MAG: sulfite exporter TauE/SafE family protein [gamma proteobacterium symbiont of Bathyaustriella thionipta]|nr:sulfite exporter TauE/SafE family protein [gamma proteobacterium symbiont of Bathyaustriella thionipta]